MCPLRPLDDDWGQKEGQLAHLDRDPSNYNEDNLAYLCLSHHDDYDTKRRQTKDLTLAEAKTARNQLYRLIENGAISRRPGSNEATQTPQVEVLRKICRDLCEARDFLQGATRRARFRGEASPGEYRNRCADSLASAGDTLAGDRLLVPVELINLCDRFIKKAFESLANFDLAQDPSVLNGFERAGFWDKAAIIAFDEIPPILVRIEEVGRSIIQATK